MPAKNSVRKHQERCERFYDKVIGLTASPKSWVKLLIIGIGLLGTAAEWYLLMDYDKIKEMVQALWLILLAFPFLATYGLIHLLFPDSKKRYNDIDDGPLSGFQYQQGVSSARRKLLIAAVIGIINILLMLFFPTAVKVTQDLERQ
ncbi:MAG: hypothetical protein ACKVZH_27105 [Blastocatellia bacterium]